MSKMVYVERDGMAECKMSMGMHRVKRLDHSPNGQCGVHGQSERQSEEPSGHL